MSNDNDPYESKGLSSLMNLLNTYEDGSCGTSTALLENQANTNNNVEKRMISNKRYIWDDEDFLNVGGVLTPSATAKPSPKAAITSDVQNIKIKMKSMQQELKKKTTYVNELKTTLARKKLAKERNCSKLKVEWAEKIKGLTGGFDNKKLCINDINHQNESTVEELKRRKKKLHANVQEIIRKAPSLCRDLQQNGVKSVQKEQHRWKAEEKSQLATKAKQKSADMKSQASKALEPELRKLVEKHTIERQKLQDEVESNIQSIQECVHREFENKFQREMQGIDSEEEVALLEIDEHYKGKLSDLTAQLQNEKKATEESAKKDKEGIMVSLQMKIDEDKRDCRRALSKWEKECAKEIKADRQAMEAHVKRVKDENSRKINALKHELTSGIEEWKCKEESSMKKNFDLLLTHEEERTRTKCEAEVAMIKEKLGCSLNEKKDKMTKQIQSELKRIKDRHDAKLKEHLQKSKSGETEYDDFKEEESYIKDQLKLTRARLTTLLETLHDVETTERTERNLNEKNERNIEIRRASEKSQGDKALRETKHLLRAMLDDLQGAELNEKEKNDVLKIEMQTLVEINEEEITKAQSRIDHVIGKKKEMLDEKVLTLASLKEKIDSMENNLAELRKTDLLAN